MAVVTGVEEFSDLRSLVGGLMFHAIVSWIGMGLVGASKAGAALAEPSGG